MIRAIGIGVAICVGVTAPSQAAPLFDLFQKTCLATRGDAAASLATLDPKVWTPLPATVLGNFEGGGGPGEVKLSGADGRGKHDVSGATMVVVMHASGIVDGQTLPANGCAVMAIGASDKESLDQATAFAAVPASGEIAAAMGDKDAKAFAWRSAGQKHVALSLNDLRAARPSADVSVITLGQKDQLTVLSLVAPAK